MLGLAIDNSSLRRFGYDVWRLVESRSSSPKLPEIKPKSKSSCPAVKSGFFYSSDELQRIVHGGKETLYLVENSWHELPIEVRQKMGDITRQYLTSKSSFRAWLSRWKMGLSLWLASWKLGADFPEIYRDTLIDVLNAVLDAYDRDFPPQTTVAFKDGTTQIISIHDAVQFLATRADDLASPPTDSSRTSDPHLPAASS